MEDRPPRFHSSDLTGNEGILRKSHPLHAPLERAMNRTTTSALACSLKIGLNL